VKTKQFLTAVVAGMTVVLSGCQKPGEPAGGNEAESSISQFVELADARIEYFSQGEGNVVVLLPGGSMSVNYLQNLAQSLDDAGYRAVRINPRGAGKSTGSAEGVTLHTLAGDVAGVIKALDVGAVHVAGHAFGNRVSRMVAADHPALVKSVVLLAAGGKVAATPEADAALGLIFNPTTSDDDYLGAMTFMVGDPADSAMVAEAMEKSRAPKAGPIQRAAAGTATLEEWWAPKGDTPYLILQGANDQAAPPENGELLKADLGDRASLVSIPKAGHMMVVTKPTVVSESIIAFTRKIDADARR
jgi:pimeloyl-ACP methyl ester carboxylesterase